MQKISAITVAVVLIGGLANKVLVGKATGPILPAYNN